MPERSTRSLMTVLFLGVLMGALDIAIVGPALPAIRSHFGVDERLLSWIFGIYVLFTLIGAPLMAKLSDRYGRRPVYLFSIALFAVGSAGVAFGINFGLLLLFRAVQGLAAGGIWPVAAAVIGESFPKEKRGSALGLIGAVFGIAFIVGPVLGGVLLLLGWQWLFLVNLPLAAFILAYGWRTLPVATQPPRSKPFDLLGMILLTLLLSGLAIGINQLDTANLGTSLTAVNVWPFLLLAGVSLPLFVRTERRAADPVIPPQLLGNRQMVFANILSAGAGLGEAALVFLPALAVVAFGYTESTASFLLMPVVLAMSIGSPTAGRLLDRYGPRLIVLVGTLLLSVGMFVLGLLGSTLFFYIVAGVLIGFGLSGLIGAPIRYVMLTEAPATDRSAAQGIVTISLSLGQLLSSALVGGVIHSYGGGVSGYMTAYLFVAVGSLALIGFALGLKSYAGERQAGASLPDPVKAQ
jgi:MFS family permease